VVKSVQNLNLLVVEDDADQRQLIRETLQDHFGLDTVVGVESIEAALALELAGFDLILTDYNLPDGTGMQFLEKIRARCATPVIMVTGENVGHIAAEAIRKGATDYVVKVGDYLFTIALVVEKNLTVAKVVRENEQLRSELEQALREVRDKNTQLEKSLKMVEELAATDPLTSLYNRRHFSRVLEQLFAESERMDTHLSCVMVDLDGFKQLNDAHGHAMGDQLLAVAGKVILANMRKMDIAARYGGDEFVLLLPHATADDALRVAQRIREQFRQGSALVLRRNEGITLSLGIASRIASSPTGGDQLVMLADTALYQAKAAGRDRAIMHA
jgi:two-component system cell cycle response regulator